MTGVEDLLADEVSECIADFRDAGISVWILTGDKDETAKQVALSCNLLDKDNLDQVINLKTLQEIHLL